MNTKPVAVSAAAGFNFFKMHMHSNNTIEMIGCYITAGLSITASSVDWSAFDVALLSPIMHVMTIMGGIVAIFSGVLTIYQRLANLKKK